ncbi:MAG: hypothetical protein ACRCVX_01375 [Shewanella sp.]
MCLQDGISRRANVVDHVEPHEGCERKFADTNNLQSLCYTHHNSTKKRQEHHGQEIGCTFTGEPVARGGSWYK